MEDNLQLAAVGVDHVEQFVVREDYVGEDDASDDDLTRDLKCWIRRPRMSLLA